MGGRCDGAGVTSAGGAELVELVTMWRYDRTACPPGGPKIAAETRQGPPLDRSASFGR